MNPVHILYPMVAMVALVAYALIRLAYARMRAVGQGEVPVEYYVAFQGGEEPEGLRVLGRHYANLFELPQLFYVACVVAYVTGTVDAVLVALAWAFVLTRYVHSYVHLTSNVVLVRFRLFRANFTVAVLMWVVLLVKLIAMGGGGGDL